MPELISWFLALDTDTQIAVWATLSPAARMVLAQGVGGQILTQLQKVSA